MSRKPIDIKQEEFQEVIADLEAKNTFKNRNKLWQAVEDTQWAKTIGLNAAVCYLRAEEWENLRINTPKKHRITKNSNKQIAVVAVDIIDNKARMAPKNYKEKRKEALTSMPDQVVITPAGEPILKPKGYTDQDLKTWVSDVKALGLKNKILYRIEAIQYWARIYFWSLQDIQKNTEYTSVEDLYVEQNRICTLIKNCYNEGNGSLDDDESEEEPDEVVISENMQKLLTHFQKLDENITIIDAYDQFDSMKPKDLSEIIDESYDDMMIQLESIVREFKPNTFVSALLN